MHPSMQPLLNQLLQFCWVIKVSVSKCWGKLLANLNWKQSSALITPMLPFCKNWNNCAFWLLVRCEGSHLGIPVGHFWFEMNVGSFSSLDHAVLPAPPCNAVS